MARPPARSLGPSTLSGRSALTPMEAPQAAPVALRSVPEAPAVTSAPVAPEIAAQAPAEPVKEPVAKPVSATAEVSKKKQSFYQLPNETDQMRGAFRSTAHSEGFESLSDFIAKAVAEKVESLQAQYNGGRPFESFGANQIPKGRPLSS